MNAVEKKRLDYLVILEEVLLAAKEQALQAVKSKDDPFEEGRVFAYYDVLTVAIEHAQLLDVDLAELGLAGFDPNKELLGHKQQAA